MTMILYYGPGSPACRVVSLTGKALGIQFDLKKVDLMKGEQYSPEFSAINPQHTVPALVDGDLKIGESRAISAYLVNQYGKDDKLYPKDPKKRAVVDMLLYFDMGGLRSNFHEAYFPVWFGGQKEVSEDAVKKIKAGLVTLDNLVTPAPYLTGSQVTIADFAVLANITNLEGLDFDLSTWPKITNWLDTMKKLPYYKEACGDDVDVFKKWVAGLMAKH